MASIGTIDPMINVSGVSTATARVSTVAHVQNVRKKRPVELVKE